MAIPAKALVRLRDQINAKWSGRSKTDDGWIGDTKHSGRVSDHNPDKFGVVHAMDFTNDPHNGFVAEIMAEALRVSGDKRIDFIISNKKIANPQVKGGIWRPYDGANPHNKHFHISVRDEPAYAEDNHDWAAIGQVKTIPLLTFTPAPILPLIRFGMRGDSVKVLQVMIGVPVTGVVDFTTEEQIKKIQSETKLTVDGIVGSYTWAAIVGNNTAP